jgi:hypothetical protein
VAPEDTLRTQPSRVLLGWMQAETALAALAGQRQAEQGRPEHWARFKQARRAAAQRRSSFGIDGVVVEDATELQATRTALEDDPRTAAALAGGMRIALVDLRRVCALQSGVAIRSAPEFDPDDLEALAAFTIHPPAKPNMDVQYDSARKAWVILAPDANFRVAGEFRTDLESGALGLGFELRDFDSRVSVGHHGDRFVLIDGYHRATTLLARGIHTVPAFVGGIGTRALIDAANGIRSEDFLGDSPPLLPDFWDDEVSAEVELPATTRVLVVEVLDIRAFE